jgi:hypothetical protein
MLVRAPSTQKLRTVHWMIGDALQHMTQMEFRIEFVELSRTQHGVDGCCAFRGRIVLLDVILATIFA